MTRDEFIEGNLPLVHKLANRFRGRGVEYEELYAAGCVGLVKAVDRFEPERGLCFSTYAVPVILGEIRRLFRDGEPLPVPSASGEDALIDRLALRQCLSELSGEDREILMLRYFRRKTQCETAQILGMTQVMVSRRERKLLKELREQLV